MREILVDHLGVEEVDIGPESRLVEDLRADELDILELSLVFEEEFEVMIPEEALKDLRTVQDFLALLSPAP